MGDKSFIVKVTFPAPVEGKREYFFGSLAAIYEKFTPYQIGCKLPTLWKASIEPGKEKKTSKCVISKHEVVRKEQQNKKTVSLRKILKKNIMDKNDLIEGSIVFVPNCRAIRLEGNAETEIEIDKTVETVKLLPANRNEVVIAEVGVASILINPQNLQGVSISDDNLSLLGFNKCERIVQGRLFENAFSFYDNAYVVKDETVYFLIANDGITLSEISEVHILQKKIFERLKIVLQADMINFKNSLGL